MAVLVAVQAQVQAFDAHIAHLHFTAKQWQHTDGEAEHLQICERLGGFDQGRDTGFVQFQAQPWEQAPADIAIERQLDVGLVAGNLANLVFIVVGIEEVRQGKAQRHNDQQQPEKYQTQDFAERFHGRVLVVKRIRNLAGEYSAPKRTTGQRSRRQYIQRHFQFCRECLSFEVPGRCQQAQGCTRLRRHLLCFAHQALGDATATGDFSYT